MILTRCAEFALAAPRRIVAVALFLLVATAALAGPVVLSLPAGGDEAPDTEAARAERVLDEKFSAAGRSLVFTVTSDAGVDSPAAAARGADILAALQETSDATQQGSYWSIPQPLLLPQLRAGLTSTDGRTGIVFARLQGSEQEIAARAHELAERFVGEQDGVTVAAGGQAVAYYEVEEQSGIDLALMEAIAIPLSFLVMVWIFGSAVAALIPVLVGICAIGLTMASLAVVQRFTDVSIFAVNLASAICLALALDYSLFIINRYREEIARGASRERALHRTLQTAGRTVSYSALTTSLVLASLLVFPQYVFRSLAYGGIAAALMSLLGALILAPAFIVAFGDRIETLDIRKPVRRWFGREAPRVRPPEEQFWYSAARFASRHAIAVVVVLVVILLGLAAPALGLRLSMPDDRALPDSHTSRQAGDLLRTEFAQNNIGTVQVVLPAGIESPAALTEYAARLSEVAGVSMVTSPSGIYAEGRSISPLAFDAAQRDDAGYLSVFTVEDPFSAAGREQVTQLHDVPAPAPVLFNGAAQRNADNSAVTMNRALVALGVVLLVTFVVIFLMTGSIFLPVKAFLMNAISLGAAFGVMVWIFQDGHLGGLGTTATGYTVVTIPPMLGILAYCLAMDYEVFVLSRIHEEWLNSDRGPEANDRAIAMGMARTGRLVTAAAAVMVVVFLGIAAGQVSFMRGFGVGLVVAVTVDAFLIRTLLVPATMSLMRRANWWAPAPLARWQQKRGLIDQDLPLQPDPGSGAGGRHRRMDLF
ncbi:MMPL family transporter [Skermania piniformis]|uniref:MMPL family transporter n=1 Tax=Skermania pinensis TaxID=39122 RepID=UPI000A78573B|nr:MMPL family transporter [Skermania piniformis]